MSRRRIALSLIAFLAALCLGVPLAFQAGWAKGAKSTAAVFYPPVVAAPVAEALGSEDFWDCYRNVRLPAIRQFDRMQDCRVSGDSGRGTARHAAARPEKLLRKASSRIRNRPLAAAVAAVVAGASETPPAEIAGFQPLGAPFDIALAPGAGSGAVGPLAGDPQQLPVNLIPPGFFAPPLNPQIPPSPVLETPIPGALPLLLTGLFGLGVAGRRKAKS